MIFKMEFEMELPAPAENILNELGLNPVISAAGTTTAYGGSRLRPEVMGDEPCIKYHGKY